MDTDLWPVNQFICCCYICSEMWLSAAKITVSWCWNWDFFSPWHPLVFFFFLFTMEEQYWFMQSRSVLWSTATAVGIFWECPAEVMSPQTLEFDSVHGKWVLHTSSVLSFAFIIWIFLVLLKSSIFGQVLIIHLTYNLIIYLRYFLEFFWGFLGYMLCVTAFFVCINIFSHSYC